MINPLLDFTNLPHFDTISFDHISPAIDRLLVDAETAVKAAEVVTPVTWNTFVTPLDDTERLGRAWNQVSHLQAVSNTPELRQAYNANLPKLTRFGSALGQNQALFAQYCLLTEAPEYSSYSDEDRKSVV